MIDYGAAINSVQFSSKSELSSRFFGRLKFLVIFCLFVRLFVRSFVRYGRWFESFDRNGGAPRSDGRGAPPFRSNDSKSAKKTSHEPHIGWGEGGGNIEAVPLRAPGRHPIHESKKLVSHTGPQGVGGLKKGRKTDDVMKTACRSGVMGYVRLCSHAFG